jgi:nitrite reductase/ring-hydroxylating ferredoxin subunit
LWQWNIQTEEIEQEAEQDLRFFNVNVEDGKIFVSGF